MCTTGRINVGMVHYAGIHEAAVICATFFVTAYHGGPETGTYDFNVLVHPNAPDDDDDDETDNDSKDGNSTRDVIQPTS